MSGPSGVGLSAAVLAYDRAASGMSAATSQLTDDQAEAPDLTNALLGVDLAIYAVRANIVAMRTTDQMLGTLVDLRA
jgi:hypothetical protein